MGLHLLVQIVLELFLTNGEQSEFILGQCFVLCLTFFILLYQLVRNLRAISVMPHGLEVCVSVVFLTCASCFLCVYWRLLGIYTRADSIQSVEGLDKLD